ncbi:MAG: hypothetical protein RL748_2689 [Pseudomonadota bacterium]|jgi:cytochrome P450
MRSKQFAPGPRGHAVLGCFAAFRDTPLDLLMSCRQEHGPVVQLPVGLGMSFCLSFAPGDLEQIFHGQQFGRSDIAAMFEPLAGGSMIIADGEKWKKQRKAVAPSFSAEKMRQLTQLIDAEAQACVGRWCEAARAGQYIDLQAQLVAYAMSTVSMFLLGRALTADEIAIIAPAWDKSLYCMNRRLSQPIPLPMWLPLPTHRQLARAAGAIADLLLGIIRERRSGGGQFSISGFLGDLLLHRDEDNGQGLSDQQILHEIMGVFLAGFDTVASGMMWTFHFLCQHPVWQEQVRADLAALPDALAMRHDLADCPVLERVFSESVRLLPPLWLVDRKNSEAVELSGHTIPANTNIITSPYVTHRDPQLWPDPLRFDPDRFLPGNSASRAKYAYFPYGGGRMKCIGILLAQLEMKSIARHALARLRLTPGNAPKIEPGFVTRTRDGIWVKPELLTHEFH